MNRGLRRYGRSSPKRSAITRRQNNPPESSAIRMFIEAFWKNLYTKKNRRNSLRESSFMKKTSLIILSLLLFALAIGSAQDKKKKEAKDVTVTGEIIDLKCYI